MKEKTIVDKYRDLADEFYKENESFLCEVANVTENILGTRTPYIQNTIEAIMVLHNFDSENADLPYSHELKSSIVNIDNNEPRTFLERVDEMSLIVSCLEGTSSFLVMEAALALHENRIVSNNHNSLPDLNEIDES